MKKQRWHLFPACLTAHLSRYSWHRVPPTKVLLINLTGFIFWGPSLGPVRLSENQAGQHSVVASLSDLGGLQVLKLTIRSILCCCGSVRVWLPLSQRLLSSSVLHDTPSGNEFISSVRAGSFVGIWPQLRIFSCLFLLSIQPIQGSMLHYGLITASAARWLWIQGSKRVKATWTVMCECACVIFVK